MLFKPQAGSPQTDVVEKLKELKVLYDAGVITEEEFQAKRAKYLDQL